MVVLAASVVTKTGKALVARVYFDMTRIRIEGLLAAFPKLVGSGKQHTYVETENVRYVYQPLEVRPLRPLARRCGCNAAARAARHAASNPWGARRAFGESRDQRAARDQGMFLLLVTNKQSNILEDLDTLRLLSKVVPEYCGVR